MQNTSPRALPSGSVKARVSSYWPPSFFSALAAAFASASASGPFIAMNRPPTLTSGRQYSHSTGSAATARALAKRPRLLLCDEPTGALDYQTGKQILALLQHQSRENGMTVVIITHNSALTAMADRVIRVRSGQITDVRQNEAPMPVESIEW